MLTWFRDNAKIFLIAVVVIFVGMIFLQWGRGGLDGPGSSRLAMGTVNGEELEPAMYDAARQEVYATMENQMLNMGYPNSESQLALMYNDINEAAFDLMVDRTLQREYLEKLGWEPVEMSLAEDLLAAQLTLMGIQDPTGYMAEYRNDPNYGATLMQLAGQAERSMFGTAVSMENMISADEIEFMIEDAMSSVSATYIPFMATPDMPSEDELRSFYDGNPELFTRSPGSRLRFAVFQIVPGAADLEASMAMVDSLAIAGGGNPDTLNITREQLEAVMGWNLDMAPGEVSRPFTAPSMARSGMQATHSVELLSVSEAATDTSGALDTLTIVHWEVPLYPGRNTVRQAFWDIEAAAGDILAEQVPYAEDYQTADYGEFIVTTETVPSPEIPQALISFATDSIWTDSIGPVFYLPSYAGGYPALMVARKMETIPGGLVGFQEALESNAILLEYYTSLQEEESLDAARQAMDQILASGISLQGYAEAESLEIYDSQQFSPASVRQWSSSQEAAYRGFLGCPGLADAALSSPEFTVIGPFVNNGVAYLAEITSRTGTQIPEDRAQLAGFYLSMQGSYSTRYNARLLEHLRENSVIEDRREEYYTTMDSLRAEYAARQQEEAGNGDY